MIASLRSPAGPGTIACHLCGARAVALLPEFATLARVTSDCQPWPNGGKLGVCDDCGAVQKVVDDAWNDEIKAIYRDYAIYHQSGGVEQPVFDRESGQAKSRSSRLLAELAARFPLANQGRLLDVGCGNGALLRAFAAIAPEWTLAGTEWDEKYKAQVERIPGVEALYTCPPEEVPGRFDLITMIHVLEHIPSPRVALARLRDSLAPGGLLVVHLPDHRQNPFELAIADHATHFSSATAAAVVAGAGYEVASVADDWVPKELTVVARPPGQGEAGASVVAPSASRSRQVVVDRLEWLDSVVSSARESASSGRFGLFGTSIAATWLTSALGGLVEFFVDEDPTRVGKAHLGRPILAPAAVPAGSTVFLALPPAVAAAVSRRLATAEVSYRMSPSLPSAAEAS